MKKEKMFRVIKGFLACVLAAVMLLSVASPVQAAVTPKKLVSQIKSGVAKYPFAGSDAVSVRKRRGKSYIFGADASGLTSFAAYQKTKGKEEYLLFVGKAKSKSKAGSVKRSLKTFIEEEASSQKNYLSAEGNRILANAKIDSDGSWVWALVLASSSDNAKADSIIRKKI